VKVGWRDSDNRLQFFYAADQATVPVSWTQLGTDVTLASAGIWDGTAQIEVGANNSGDVWVGKIYYFALHSGLAGSDIVVMDPNLWRSGSTWTSTTGEVWTLNGLAAVTLAA
jgi:hypothetical protein